MKSFSDSEVDSTKNHAALASEGEAMADGLLDAYGRETSAE